MIWIHIFDDEETSMESKVFEKRHENDRWRRVKNVEGKMKSTKTDEKIEKYNALLWIGKKNSWRRRYRFECHHKIYHKIIYESWWRTLIIFRKDTGYRTTITNWYSSWDEIHVCQIIFDVKVIMSLTFFLDLKMKESFCTIRITTISISIDSIHLIKNYMSLRKTSWSVKKEVITWRQVQLIPAHSCYSFSSASY